MPENKNVANLEGVTMEELQQVLANRGIDFKELAAEAKIAKNLNGSTSNKKNKVTAGWEIEMNDHADFCIRKNSGPKSWKRLVVMPSQGTCFFKDQAGNITPLTADMLKGFMRGMPKLEINSWVDHIEGGADEANALLRILTNKTLMEMEKLNIGPRFNHRKKEDSYYKFYWVNNVKKKDLYDDYEKSYKLFPQLLKTFAGQYDVLDMIVANRYFFYDIVTTFGIQNARDFVEESKRSLAILDELDNGGYKRDYYADNAGEKDRASRPNIEMDYKVFKDYILYDSVFFGFAKNIKEFMSMWNDTLRMQDQIYGKIKYKYPKDLLLLHQQLSYKSDVMQEEINEKNFKKNAERAAQYEATVGDYVFIAPKVKQDFYDEATAQANCLASYVQRFTDGQDIIMFMRHKETPEDSLVTIELVNDKIVQKYQARNIACTPEQNEVIEKWLHKITKKESK